MLEDREMNRVLVLVVVMLLAMPAGLFAATVYSENYDSLALGAPAGWMYTQNGEAVVSNNQASSGTQSLAVVNYLPEGGTNGLAYCPITPITGTNFEQTWTMTIDNASSSWTNFFMGASSVSEGINLQAINVGTRSSSGNDWWYDIPGHQVAGVPNTSIGLGTWENITADYHWNATLGIYDQVTVNIAFATKQWLNPGQYLIPSAPKGGGYYYYDNFTNDLTSLGCDTVDSVFFGSNGTQGATIYVDNMSVTTTPEPATMVLLGIGGMAMLRRRFAK
jgi:hypothetical protein